MPRKFIPVEREREVPKFQYSIRGWLIKKAIWRGLKSPPPPPAAVDTVGIITSVFTNPIRRIQETNDFSQGLEAMTELSRLSSENGNSQPPRRRSAAL
ncbi:hypothetical protein SDJN03_18579, partial [Cucurbita argyrosperma subsp. sororia]